MEKISAFQKENLTMTVHGYHKNEAGIMLMSQQMQFNWPNTFKHVLNQTIYCLIQQENSAWL